MVDFPSGVASISLERHNTSEAVHAEREEIAAALESCEPMLQMAVAQEAEVAFGFDGSDLKELQLRYEHTVAPLGPFLKFLNDSLERSRLPYRLSRPRAGESRFDVLFTVREEIPAVPV